MEPRIDEIYQFSLDKDEATVFVKSVQEAVKQILDVNVHAFAAVLPACHLVLNLTQ